MKALKQILLNRHEKIMRDEGKGAAREEERGSLSVFLCTEWPPEEGQIHRLFFSTPEDAVLLSLNPHHPIKSQAYIGSPASLRFLRLLWMFQEPPRHKVHPVLFF